MSFIEFPTSSGLNRSSSSTESLLCLRKSRTRRALHPNPLIRRLQLLQRLLVDLKHKRVANRSAELVLPLRPMSKARPRSTRFRSAPYTDRVYANWIKDAVTHLKEWWTDPPLQKTEAIKIQLFGPARGDVDNRVGSVFDALVQAGVIKDDNVNVIDDLRVKFYKRKTKDAQVIIRIDWEE